MSGSQKGSSKPGPEALAYGSALRVVFEKQSLSQTKFALKIPIDHTQLSRCLSGQRIADRSVLEGLVRAVRESADVSDDELAELHRLRQTAQAASDSQKVRLAVLQEQMDEVKVLVGTFREQVQGLTGANVQLEERVDRLLRRVEEEEERADREHDLRLAEQERRERAEEAAESSALELEAARSQLSAAAEYARESDAVLKEQRDELRMLRQEVKILRGQVQRMTEGASVQVQDGVADAASQVKDCEETPGGKDDAGLATRVGAAVTPEIMAGPAPSGDQTALRETGARGTPSAEVTYTRGGITPRVPKPPLDLLAELTSTPPPPPSRAKARRARQKNGRRTETAAQQVPQKGARGIKDGIAFTLSFLFVSIMGIFLRAAIVNENFSFTAWGIIVATLAGMLWAISFVFIAAHYRITKMCGIFGLGTWGIYFFVVSPWFSAPTSFNFIEEMVRNCISG